MKLITRNLSIIALGLSLCTAVSATPSFLSTHNKTDVESNAYIAGIPSIYPTAPNSSRSIAWNLVRIACFGHSPNNKCSATIKMATNTSNPIELGTVTMDTITGEITPKVLSANGYTLTVIDTAETTITKD